MKLKRKTWWKTCFLLLLVFACNGCKDEKNEEGGTFLILHRKLELLDSIQNLLVVAQIFLFMERILVQILPLLKLQ